MTVPFDIPFGYAAGSVLALVARRPLVRTVDPLHSRYAVVAALFGAAALAPTGVLLYAQFPDWMLMYLASPAFLPAWLMYPLLFASYAASPLIGFLATHAQLVAYKRNRVRISLGLTALILGLVLTVGGRRLLRVGYYEAFHTGGATEPLFGSALLLPLAGACVAVVGALVFSILQVRKHVEIAENLPATLEDDAAPAARPGASTAAP